MRASDMTFGKRYRLLPAEGLKTEAHNAIIEMVEELVARPDWPLVRAIKVGKRTRRGWQGSIIRAGEVFRLSPDWEIEEAD